MALLLFHKPCTQARLMLLVCFCQINMDQKSHRHCNDNQGKERRQKLRLKTQDSKKDPSKTHAAGLSDQLAPKKPSAPESTSSQHSAMTIKERNVGNQGPEKDHEGRTSGGRTGKRLHRWNCSRRAGATLLRANQLPDKAARTKSCNFFIEKEYCWRRWVRISNSRKL